VKIPESLRQTLCITCLGFSLAASASAFAAPAGLAPASSSELQALLAVQTRQTKVVFSNHALPRVAVSAFDRLFMWNEIALDTTAIDHTPLQLGELRVFGEQFGPTRSSRAMAIVHIAMFEAENAVTQRFQSYAHVAPVSGDVSVDYAIAQAMHDALLYLYPSQKPRLDALLAADVAHIHASVAALVAGQALGVAAAQAIVWLRSADGSQFTEPVIGGPFTPIGGVGHWSVDPVSQLNIYLGAYWGQVTPFTMTSGSQFRAPPPPALTDPAYTDAFKQVQKLGGDPRFGTPTERTGQETFDGIFWSYDGTPALCAPPRLYNQVARAIALEHGMTTLADAGRMLALINTAMADAAISAWDTKWHYQFWRPVTAIRSADQGGNTTVHPDPKWYPLGGQATNSRGPNFTPPFPAYVSGHATIGGALFQIMRHYYPDSTPFVFVSDEWNGVNTNDKGQVKPYRPKVFTSFTQAEYLNAESRVWLGVHWQFDADMGVAEGHNVADWVWGHAFQPK
jgi:membrane-associated phospholipid phosphatase